MPIWSTVAKSCPLQLPLLPSLPLSMRPSPTRILSRLARPAPFFALSSDRYGYPHCPDDKGDWRCLDVLIYFRSILYYHWFESGVKSGKVSILDPVQIVYVVIVHHYFFDIAGLDNCTSMRGFQNQSMSYPPIIHTVCKRAYYCLSWGML